MDTSYEEAIYGLILGTILLLFFASVFIYVIFKSQKKQLKNALENDRMKKLFEENILKAQIEIQNETLQNVGQNLHDNIGQLLTVARISLSLIEGEQLLPLGLKHKVQETAEIIDQSIGEIRLLTKSMDSNFVKNFGLLESVQNEITRINKINKFSVDLQVHGTIYNFPINTEIVLFRVLQESLNNAIKYSGANQMNFTFDFTATNLMIKFRDNGRGFDPDEVLKRKLAQSGAGLRNIIERVKLIGGVVEILSSPGAGTTIIVSISKDDGQ